MPQDANTDAALAASIPRPDPLALPDAAAIRTAIEATEGRLRLLRRLLRVSEQLRGSAEKVTTADG
jgi:hypothetical protein